MSNIYTKMFSFTNNTINMHSTAKIMSLTHKNARGKKYVSLNTGIGAGYHANWGKSATLSATASIGGTIKF